MKKPRTKTVLRVLIPLLILAAMCVSIFCFMEVEMRGVICIVRRFYATPYEAMEMGDRLNWQLTEYGLGPDTPIVVNRIDESNAICIFLCGDVLVIEEMYTKEGGWRVVGTETVRACADVVRSTELGDLDYTELWLLLPNGRYGKKCSYALRAEEIEPPPGASVFPVPVQERTWSLIVTDPR